MHLTQPTGEFEWTQEPWGRALRCTALCAPHLFSTVDLDLRTVDGRPAAGWDRLGASLGVRAGNVVRAKQVHGDATRLVSEPADDLLELCAAAADIIMTANADIAVAVRAADCVPLLFEDRRSGAVAAAHAGWKGTAAGVARKTAHALAHHFGARAADLVVAIGPSIGPCCYQVGEELLPAFGPGGRRWFYRPPSRLRDLGEPSVQGRLMLNLWSANRDQLLEAGVSSENLHVAELCTVMHPDLFPSYRRDGKSAGRFAAVIKPPGRLKA